MSTVMTPPLQQLRPLVHEKIDQLSDTELAAVHKQLLMLELRREFDVIGGEMANDWHEGRITIDKVEEIIRGVRASHPYQNPGKP